MKNKIGTILLILFIFSFTGCNKDNITESNQINPLKGNWSCTFTYYPDIMIPEQTSPILDTLISILEFTDDSFSLKIDRLHNIFSKNYQYNGTYSIIRDTIKFYVSAERSFMEDFIYNVKEHSLNISTAPKADSTGIMAIRMNSFLWGYTWNNSGSFIRLR